MRTLANSWRVYFLEFVSCLTAKSKIPSFLLNISVSFWQHLWSMQSAHIINNNNGCRGKNQAHSQLCLWFQDKHHFGEFAVDIG